MVTTVEAKGVFIGGGWKASTGTEIVTLVNPANGEPMGEMTVGTAEDVASAVRAAKESLRPWAAVPLDRRVEIMLAVAAGIESHADELARLQTIQMGAPIAFARNMMTASVNLLHSYLDSLASFPFEFLRSDPWGQSLVRREPVGVVGAITPWNGPVPIAVNKLVPAFLAGCTVVIKPAPETPADTSLLAEIFDDAGLPPGVLNVVTGGRTTGEALAAHPDVTKVSFTGSSAAAQHIGRACVTRFARVSFELGGKSAAIVLDDADFPTIMPTIAAANFANSGQNCIAFSRVLVSQRRYDEFVAAAAEIARTHVVGDPLDTKTTLGPLVASRQLNRVLRYLEIAREQGAKFITGGRQPPHLEKGYFVEPTVLAGVDNEMTTSREEIFGPVMSVISCDSVDEAINIANDSDYGLHGGVFTTDHERGLDIAKRIETGSVAINGFGTNPTAPFGGIKMSGIGREHGPEGLAAFCETKAYVIPKELFYGLRQQGIATEGPSALSG